MNLKSNYGLLKRDRSLNLFNFRQNGTVRDAHKNTTIMTTSNYTFKNMIKLSIGAK